MALSVGSLAVLALTAPWSLPLVQEAFTAFSLLALVHLVTLGFVGSMIIGASYQLVPVAIGVHLSSVRLGRISFWFYAAGLALFAVSGASKALALGAGPVAALLLGMLTGIGGGIVRDVLVREIPTVLRTELYAVAAVIGAAVVVIGRLLHLPSAGAGLAGAALCFGLRLMAMRRGWQLPIARSPKEPDR